MKEVYFEVGYKYHLTWNKKHIAEYIGNGVGVIVGTPTENPTSSLDIGSKVAMTINKSWVLLEEPIEGVNNSIRTFGTGANRNSDEGKLDFEGFLSPTVLKAYAEYMHNNRKLEDGTLRDSDNWQKGMPKSAYMKSMFRHFFDTWSNYRGLETPETQKQNLCGMLFNTMGMLHEILKEENEQ